MKKSFDPGFDIQPRVDPLGFEYGIDVFGPEVENRRLDDIRPSLRDPHCSGPEIVYSIAMDVGKREHREQLQQQHLLFGAVSYAAGRLGDEPIRSQGHIHRASPRNGWSTPEVYEIWAGAAYIYMQERAADDPGRCFAVRAEVGDIVVVPPAWAHATISADPRQALVFGAWCDRDYGFEYAGVRRHHGLAWFPILNEYDNIEWEKNPHYHDSKLQIKSPADYSALGIETGIPIYRQFVEYRERFLFVPDPALKKDAWVDFVS